MLLKNVYCIASKNTQSKLETVNRSIEGTQLASELERLLQPTELEEQSALVTNEQQQSLTHFKFKGIIAQKFGGKNFDKWGMYKTDKMN